MGNDVNSGFLVMPHSTDFPGCPLCGGQKIRLIEKISYDEIRYVFRRVYGVKVDPAPVRTVEYMNCNDCDLLFFVPSLTGDAVFYERLQALPWYYLEEKSEYEIARGMIAAGSSVLEIGCGSGVFASYLSPACSYWGLEYNVAAVDRARKRGLHVTQETIEEFANLHESSFDVVCAFQVLEHVASPASFINAAKRLLKSGGIFITAVPSEDSFMADELNNVLNLPPHHVTRWTDKALKNVVRLGGLELQELKHESVSDFNLPSFYKAKLWRFLRQRCRLRVPLVSVAASASWVRVPVDVAARILARCTPSGRLDAAGHSVVATYRKVQECRT